MEALASRRPVTNYSFGLNYAVGAESSWGYHLVNLVVHVLAGLTLFGLLRRTLLTERLKDRFGRTSTVVGFAVALLWIVNPLQTQSVTYLVQRAESLMGLF